MTRLALLFLGILAACVPAAARNAANHKDLSRYNPRTPTAGFVPDRDLQPIEGDQSLWFGICPDPIDGYWWHGLNNRGKQVSRGVYFYRLVTKGYTKTRKMVLLK